MGLFPLSPEYSSALILSFLAGMSTCLGAGVAFCCDRRIGGRHNQLAFALSLAGSVMITVSITSILPEAFSNDKHKLLSPTTLEFWQRCLAFVTGCALYMLLSKYVFPPEPQEFVLFEDEDMYSSLLVEVSTPGGRVDEDGVDRIEDCGNQLMPRKSSQSQAPRTPPHSQQQMNQNYSPKRERDQLAESHRNWRVAMLLFLSLAVHNFPEGLAVAASSMHSEHLGWTTTVAIAMHNIPEGIAIAVPCVAARPDAPWLAFGLASASGLAEPLGALVALLFVGERGSVNSVLDIESVLAFVAGIMIMVAVIELFPEAKRNTKTSRVPAVCGSVVGIVVMLASDSFLES